MDEGWTGEIWKALCFGSLPCSSQCESVTSASLRAKPHVRPRLHFPFTYDRGPEIAEPSLLASPTRNSSTPPFSSLSYKTSAMDALTVIPVHTWLKTLYSQMQFCCFVDEDRREEQRSGIQVET